MGLKSSSNITAAFRPAPRGAAAGGLRPPCGCPDRIEAARLRLRRPRLNAEMDAFEQARSRHDDHNQRRQLGGRGTVSP